jgi:RHS repeat-associated protein
MGLEPQLSLTYGGTTRNGVLGVGWSLEGLSSITRCRHTHNRDGYSAPIADDRTDRYCIDGVQLNAQGEAEYGGDGTHHFPEFDVRTRVTSYGVNPSGPDWFEVRRSNGLIYIYGRSDRASVFSGTNVKREWALERVEDRVGNYIQISYQKLTGLINGGTTGSGQYILASSTEMVPTTISYAGFSGSSAPPAKLTRAITFTYEDRPDPNVAFLAGHATWRTRRLKKIATKLGFSTVRSYNIIYGDEVDAPAANRASRIAQVEECGGDGVCLPPTSFDYFDDEIVSFSEAQSAGVTLKGEKWGVNNDIANVPSPLVRFKNGPVDDVFYGFHYTRTRESCNAGAFLCGLAGEEETEEVSFGSWAFIRGGSSLPLGHEAVPFAHKYKTVVDVCDDPSWAAKLYPIGDFDLDGHDDLIDYEVFGRTRFRWLPGGSNPRSLQLYPQFDACNHQWPELSAITDITGDGRPDALACWGDRLELHEHVGREALMEPKVLPSDGTCGATFLDIDGDGTPNLLGSKLVPIPGEPLTPPKRIPAILRYRADTEEGTWDPSFWPMNSCYETPSGMGCTSESPTAARWIELNGDGLKDFVAIKTHFTGSSLSDLERVDTTHAWLNTGRTFVEVGVDVEITPKELEKALVADLNQDGREELVMPLVHEYFGPEENVPPNEWRVVGWGPTLAERARFDTGVPLGEGIRPSFATDQIFYSSRHDAVFADVNGDTVDDLVMISGPSGNQRVFVLSARVSRANLLSSVTDGLGRRITVRWDPGEHLVNDTYTPATDCSSDRCETKAVVVSEHSEWQVPRDGSAPRGERMFMYLYRDGRTSPADGKFLGFGERTIVERRGAGASAGAWLRETFIQFENSTGVGGIDYPLAGRRKLVRVMEPQVDSDIAPGLTSNRVTETEFDWDRQAGYYGHFASLESRTTRISEFVTPGPVEPTSHLFLTIKEDFDSDLFGNVTRIDRTEFTPTTTLTTSTIETVYQPLSHTSEWLIALPERRTVTDRVWVTAPDRSESRRTEFTYYPGTNLLHHVTREPLDDNYYLDTELVRFAQDPYGNVEQIVQTTRGPEPERRSAIIYDHEGIFPSTFTSGAGTSVQLTAYVAYDARFGTPTLTSDPNGIASQWAYDSFGRMTRQRSPSTESQTEYSADVFRTSEVLPTFGALTVTTETAGYGRTEVGVDAFGRTVRTATTGLLGEDVLTETLYDDAGRVARQSRPHAPGIVSQHYIQYDYDEASRLSKVTQADQTTIEFEYASIPIVDNLAPELGALPANYLWFTRTKDPKGNLSLSIADQRGQMAASRDAGGAWVLATAGPFGTVPQVIAAGLPTTYEYDRYGKVTLSADYNRRTERYTYTHYDELFEYFVGTELDPSLSHGYDQLGRLRTISARDAGTATYSTATYNYGDGSGGPNQIGRLVNTTSIDGSYRSFTYEPPAATSNRGFLATVTDVVEGETMTTELEYNGFGQLFRTRYPGATPFVVERQFDAGGNLRAIGSENFVETYWMLLETHQGYLPAQERYGGSNASDLTMVDHDYEPLTGRVHRITSRLLGGPIRDFGHLYDANGNLEARWDNLTAPEQGVELFTYDERDRLGAHVLDGALLETIAYTPDGSGNIDSRLTSGSYLYDPIPNRPAHMPSSTGNTVLGFDPRGTGNVSTRVIGSTYQNFSYDAFGMPTRIGFNTDVEAVRLKYHTTGERSAKLLSDGRAVRYSGDYEREITQSGTTEHRYRLYTPFGPLGEVVKSDTGSELSKTYWHKDLLGSPELITNHSGSPLHRQKFSAFGESDNPTWQSSDPAVRRIRRGYTGHEHDPETGLVNMNARMYDPRIARFMTPDLGVQIPGWTQSWNRFSYAWNSPYSWVDPTGLTNATIENDAKGNQTITFADDPLKGYVPEHPTTQLESPAPLTAPFAGETPDVRTPAEAPGASPGDEFLPAEWEDPPVPNQGFAPKPRHTLTEREFQITDTSETWEKSLQYSLALTGIGQAAFEIGIAIKTIQFVTTAEAAMVVLPRISGYVDDFGMHVFEWAGGERASFVQTGGRVVVDYLRKGGAPPGQAGTMLAKSIRAAGGARPTELFAPNVLQKAPNSTAKLIDTLRNTVDALGGRVTGVTQGIDAGKHWVRVTIAY